ncbi:hypothetical protein SAMN04487936_11155 [Halobacillus dabanensis]|uniref:Uncharacterized protein n=1 Tax=Halobacillus dabanensis TaxID=240302 RepID=A0A1I3YK22_HALDA|nr:hypothetical protein [Halobacillus dabanensis]SFK32164.1 hypothetical protein SAMN04487936_11155 [Halobacillus dabanensis]
MSEAKLKKIRRVLLYTAFLMAAFVISYFIAYPLGYSPYGYEVLENKEGGIVLQSYNTFGLEGERVPYQPREGEEWKQEWLVDLIGQQEFHYHLFFTSMIVAVFWVGMDVVKGKSLKSALILSCFYVFTSGLSLVQHLDDIKDILHSSL